nr:hypothetical protein [Bacteroidales bacterium]
MNKNYNIQSGFTKAVFCAILFLPLLLSCAKKELEVSESVGDVLYSFKAEIDMGFIPEDLKSTVTLSTGASSFVSGDEVAVTLGSTIGIYRYDGSTFNFVSGTAQSGTLTYATAFYPASMVTGKGDGRSFNLSLEDLASQSYQTTTLSNLPMGGRFIGEGTSAFKFYNLCTILKISASDGAATSGKTLSSVTFTSHESSISGAAGYANGKMQMDPAADDDERTITVTGSPSSLGSPTPWYLILPSQTYPGGFELKLAFSDGKTFTYSTSNTVALQPGYISAMDAFTCEYFSGGSGSKANPYRIASSADLRDMNNRITERFPYNVYTDEHPRGYWSNQFRDKHYILLVDIDYSSGGVGVIGTEDSQRFTGSFDGQGHTLRNFWFDRGEESPRCALFGTLDGGTVKNLNINNVTKTGRKALYTSVLAARALNGSLIENCHVSGAVLNSTSTEVGVLAGELSESTIRNCSVTNATVTGAGGSSNGTGGLVGLISGTTPSLISHCSLGGTTAINVIANSSSEADHAGGLV